MTNTSEPLVLVNFFQPTNASEISRSPHGIANMPTIRSSLSHNHRTMGKVFIQHLAEECHLIPLLSQIIKKLIEGVSFAFTEFKVFSWCGWVHLARPFTETSANARTDFMGISQCVLLNFLCWRKPLRTRRRTSQVEIDNNSAACAVVRSNGSG